MTEKSYNLIKQNRVLKRCFRCILCNQPFFKTDILFKSQRYPILLQCGHSSCQLCLQQSLKEANKIICERCELTMETTNNSELVSENFAFNFYISGCLLVHENYYSEKDHKLKCLSANDANFKYKVKEQLYSKPACEECQVQAQWFCEKCNENFCEFCWERVHSCAKSLKKHIKMFVTNGKDWKILLDPCPEHKTKNLEFFCKDCLMEICSYCMISNHQGEGHNLVHVKDKNEDLQKAVEGAVEISNRVRHSLEVIQSALKYNGRIGKLFEDFRSQISENFSRVHGILQLQEDQLLHRLHEAEKTTKSHLYVLREKLLEQLECLSRLLCEYEYASKNSQVPEKLGDILSDVQRLPCYLVTSNMAAGIKLEFDESVVDSLNTYCTLEIPSLEPYTLRSKLNLPEDFIDDFSNGNLCSGQPSEENVEGVYTYMDSELLELNGCESFVPLVKKLDGSNPSEPSMVQSRLIEPSEVNDVFVEKKKLLVQLTYIKNPGEFYVILNTEVTKRRSLEMNASKLSFSEAEIPNAVYKDEVYLINYKNQKMNRVRVVEVISGYEAAKKRVRVFFLDYGFIVTVLISRLRQIPKKFLEVPPLAVKCKLFDCMPKSGNWCGASTKTMKRIFYNSRATIFIMKVHPDCLEVDLSNSYPENKIGSDIVSMRDCLVFMGYTNLVVGGRASLSTALAYPSQALPPTGESMQVFITHVNSSADFYVQRTDQDFNYFHALLNDLQRYYRENDGKGFIYNPAVGMPCAALFSVDRKWYRAEILDISKRKMLKVLYVDYGNKETVEWNSVRKIKESFVELVPLAFRCGLSKPELEDLHNWNLKTKEYLEENVQHIPLRMKIVDVLQPKQKLVVSLHLKVNGKEVCINNMFCDAGSLSGDASLLSRREKNDINFYKSPVIEENDAGFGFEESESGETKDLPNEKNEKLAQYQDGLNIDSLKCEKFNANQESEENSPGSPGNGISMNDVFIAKVNILSASSPSSIYVTFPELSGQVTELQTALNEFYKDFQSAGGEEWIVDAKCVVYSSLQSNWYRAIILELLPDDNVKVFLRDVAVTLIEPISSLRVLDESFLKYPICAIKCHLGDVCSVEGAWPSVSCEFLSNEIEAFDEIYMTKKGKIEDGSLPIELWVKKIVPGTALEPTLREWISINQMMIDQGLALPIKLGIYRCLVSNSEIDACGGQKRRKCKKTSKSSSNLSLTEETTYADHHKLQTLTHFHWLPPRPLRCSSFIVVPTYIDNDATIHLYDVEEDSEKLKLIRETLLDEFRNSEPSPDDYFWRPGEACIVKYHADGCWYRGIVLEVNENLTYEVLFIDYGNPETCKAFDLRKKINMTEIPILSHKFTLKGIKPASQDGQWSVSHINLLHSSIVDKKCEITVVSASDNPNEASEGSLKIVANGFDVISFLVDKGVAVIDSSS